MRRRPDDRIEGERFQTKGALHEHVRQMVMLERLCSRFHLVVEQLRSRHENRESLRVEDEYDVRDLLQALLTLEHDDIGLEEWTPTYAGGNPRRDFFLKKEQIFLEARKTRSGWGAQELKEQLRIDVQKYSQRPDGKTLVCFVYDPDGRIPDPISVENELRGERNGFTVRVLIAPRDH